MGGFSPHTARSVVLYAEAVNDAGVSRDGHGIDISNQIKALVNVHNFGTFGETALRGGISKNQDSLN